MAEEFTFANVRRAVGGIARYVASQKPKGARVMVGRDPRFLGETFCSMASEILERHGITPVIVAEAAPTPAFAYVVVQTKADGVINFTLAQSAAVQRDKVFYSGWMSGAPRGYLKN